MLIEEPTLTLASDDTAGADAPSPAPAPTCPICQSGRLHYAFSDSDARVLRCADCGLLRVDPRTAGHVVREESSDAPVQILGTIRQAMALLSRYRDGEQGNVLIVTAGQSPSLWEAEAVGAGMKVTSVRLFPADEDRASRRKIARGTIECDDLATAGLREQSFDLCILPDAMESTPDAMALLSSVHRLLKPGGTLLATAHAARPVMTLGGRFTCFDRATFETALHRADFRGIVLRDLDGVMLAMSHAVDLPQKRTLSVILPAFNEASTVGDVLDALLAKEVPGLEIEVIVVESNSTDGTRDVVLGYAKHPRVRVLLQERPRGKGNAVRAGLDIATGDYILIQDADLEYDFEDYDGLIEPLVAGREALVLGARHGGGAWWKMRQFNSQPILSLFFNCGHWFFTALLNTLFRQSLKDPFTMFKVFRRDCLYGLEFTCDRFDFDHELLVKLVRKGYRAAEIPVNYRSRSFKEGKKVSTFRDPWTWVKALVRMRFQRIDPLAAIERRRLALRAERPAWGDPDRTPRPVPTDTPHRREAA